MIRGNLNLKISLDVIEEIAKKQKLLTSNKLLNFNIVAHGEATITPKIFARNL